jgi:hypothetical protein
LVRDEPADQAEYISLELQPMNVALIISSPSKCSFAKIGVTRE